MAQNITFDVIARDKASSTFSRISRSSDSTAGRLAKFGKKASLALGGLGFAAGAVVKNSISLEASFSKTMAQVAASTGAPQAALGKMNELAMKLGAQTKFSANEAAGAMLELAKAGIATKDIMGGALSGTLLLAAAGDTDLATAATIASNAMNTFNLRGKDMNSIASALAGGALASSASVESLGQALQQVGPGALNAGLSLQETVAALSAFDAAGIKGSDAGTSLKTMLARLVPQTDAASAAMRKYNLDFTDAKGNFVSITNVADQLRTGLGKLSEAERVKALATIFGSDATRAATVLMKEGADGIGGFIKATKDQGAAQKMAAANMSGTAGALERLKGSIETAQLALGKALAPTIQKTADFLSEEAVPALTMFIKGMQDGTGAGGDMAAGIKTLASAAKSAVKFIDSLPGPVKKIGVEGLVAAYALSKLTSVTSRVGASLASPIARTKQFAAELTYTETRMQRVSMASRRLGAGLKNLAGVGGMVALADGAQKSNKALGALEMAAGGAAVGFAVGGPWGAAIGGAAGGLWGLMKATDASTKATKVSLPTWKQYGQTLDGVAAATTRATRAMVLERLEKSGLLEATRRLGLTDREAVSAMMGNIAARQKLARELRIGHGLTDAQRAALEKETGAVARSRLQTLQHNVAIAQNAKELRKAQIALRKFIKEPSSKRLSITGVEGATAKMNSLRHALAQVWGLTKDINTAGPGGIGVLLTTPTGRAMGGPVRAGTPYIVGERRPELFVPNQSGRIIPDLSRVPGAGSSGGDQVIEIHMHLEGETLVKQIRLRNKKRGVVTAAI